MRSKALDAGGTTASFALIFDKGDEVMATLKSFAREQRLGGSRFTAIGALSDATIGWFDWDRRDYRRIRVEEQVEVVSLVGDVALTEEGEPKVHAHVVLGRRDGTAMGGHLIEGRVRPTLELMLEEAPVHLRRKHDDDSGLALIWI